MLNDQMGMHKNLHAIWGLVPQHSNIHSPPFLPTKAVKFFIQIYTFSRAEKHPSETGYKNRRREQVGSGTREKVGTVTHMVEGKAQREVRHITALHVGP